MILSIFSYTFWLCVYPLWKNVYSGLLLIFLTGLFGGFCYWLFKFFNIFWIWTPSQILILKYFPSFHRLCFRFVERFLFLQGNISVWCSPLGYFLLLLPLLLVSNPKKSSPRQTSRSSLSMFSFRSFMVSGLMFKS